MDTEKVDAIEEYYIGELEIGEQKVDLAYRERNAVVLAFAALAAQSGWTMGTFIDENEPDWPVLIIDTPYGQVSWHFKAEELPTSIGLYHGEWDGHTTEQKYDRLSNLVTETFS